MLVIVGKINVAGTAWTIAVIGMAETVEKLAIIGELATEVTPATSGTCRELTTQQEHRQQQGPQQQQIRLVGI
jgi:hypothetical protein